MPEQTPADFAELERARDLPPDELYEWHRYCPDEEGLCRVHGFEDECPNIEQEDDDGLA